MEQSFTNKDNNTLINILFKFIPIVTMDTIFTFIKTININ